MDLSKLQPDKMVSLLNMLTATNVELKREVDQLKRENIQIKLNHETRINSLDDEICSLVTAIKEYSVQINPPKSESIDTQIRQNQTNETEQITADFSLVNINDNSAFASVPDNVIGLILMRLSLQDRVLLRIICRRWKSVIEEMCRSVRLLQLFGHRKLNYNKETDEHNLLLIDIKRDINCLFPKIPEGIFGSQIQFIPQLFCNVDQVVLSFPKTFDITIMQLLESMEDRLTSLTLDIKLVGEYVGAAIWHRITQMPKLESLSLHKNILYSPNIPDSELTFLKQLKHLMIVSPSHRIFKFMIGSNMQCLELRSFDANVDIYKAIQENPASVANVSHFKHSIPQLNPSANQHFNVNQPLLDIVCRHFVSLTDLELDFLIQVGFKEQLTQLSQLPHLIKLHLYLANYNFSGDLFGAIQFGSLQSLVLNIWIIPNQTIQERVRIVLFFSNIPNIFQVLKELKIVARNKSTIQSIEELVNGSVLKSFERIKYDLIELL